MGYLDDIMAEVSDEALSKKFDEPIQSAYNHIMSRIRKPTNYEGFMQVIGEVTSAMDPHPPHHAYCFGMELLMKYVHENDPHGEYIPDEKRESFYKPVVYRDAMRSESDFRQMMDNLKTEVISHKRKGHTWHILTSVIGYDWEKKVAFAKELFDKHPDIFPKHVETHIPEQYAHQTEWLLAYYNEYLRKKDEKTTYLLLN